MPVRPSGLYRGLWYAWCPHEPRSTFGAGCRWEDHHETERGARETLRAHLRAKHPRRVA